MTDETAIVPADPAELMPINPRDVAGLRHAIEYLRDHLFTPEVDFGVVPGAKKPSLLLPGMEKIMRRLQCRPEYIQQGITVIDFDKPLFFFSYECRIVDVSTNQVLYSAIGSANSHESKYRYRAAKRACPSCGQETIIKSKAEFGGGWYCLPKTGGCGAGFDEKDTRITGQALGLVENKDAADLIDTLQKMAQKRALSSAVKGVANVSDLFVIGDEADSASAASGPAERSGDNGGAGTLSNGALRTAFFKSMAARGIGSAEVMAKLNSMGVELASLTPAQAAELVIQAPTESAAESAEIPF